MTDEKSHEPEKKNSLAVWLIILTIILIVIFGSLASNRPRTTTNSQSKACDLNEYKQGASQVMYEVSQVGVNVNFNDSASRKTARTELLSLQVQINQLNCRSAYPLKHETLEYTVIHFLDALKYADEGNIQKRDQSMDKAILNLNRFNDWSVDIGN